MADMSGEKAWNQQIIEEFRGNGGQVGGRFEGTPLVLLTTTGRQTGSRHTTPVMYRREGERIFVFASSAGRDAHPNWYRNLVEDPQVHVELGTDAHAARAVVLDGADRDEVWARHAAQHPRFAEYQRQTERVIPVVELRGRG
jgi:deazaflavin-dependent oxidoreductase (nitroreductase family)